MYLFESEVCITMKISINRNSKLFRSDQADELNKAFSSIMDKIQAYQPETKDYKEEVQYFRSSGFRVGDLICIRKIFDCKREYNKFETVDLIDKSIPFEVWTKAISEKNETMNCLIKGNEIKLYGVLSSYPQKMYISEDIVVPSVT